MANRKVVNDSALVVAFGQNLKRIRKQKYKTCAELSKKMGLSASSINRYERGVSKHVPLGIVDRFADALEVSPQELIFTNLGIDQELTALLSILKDDEKENVKKYIWFIHSTQGGK